LELALTLDFPNLCDRGAWTESNREALKDLRLEARPWTESNRYFIASALALELAQARADVVEVNTHFFASISAN